MAMFLRSQLPRALPTWRQMVESLGSPTPAELARALGVSERTIWNYHRRDEAPRATMLALFWITPWGHSQLDCQRENLVRVLQSLTKSLENANAALHARVSKLDQLDTYGSANAPAMEPGALPVQVFKGGMVAGSAEHLAALGLDKPRRQRRAA